MTGRFATTLIRTLFVCLVCALPSAHAQTLDNGIDPSNLGKGDWIYSVDAATNKLGGTVPGVTSVPTLMSYFKSLGMKFLVVKVGTGSTNYNALHFNSNLIQAAHSAGLKLFGYTRSYGDDIPGEIALASKVYEMGADGFVIDAEAEWESSHLGANGPALALQLCHGIKAKYPRKFLAHAPFPIITQHPTFPYREFGLGCDAVMPQAYWKRIGSLDRQPLTPERMVSRMNLEWLNWQNSLTGIYTNAIKPIAPIAQGWNLSASKITGGTELIRFISALKAEPNPASRTGYKGVSFWRTDLHSADMWPAISFVQIGDPFSLPAAKGPELVTIPASTNGTSVVTSAVGLPQMQSNLSVRLPSNSARQTNNSYPVNPGPDSSLSRFGSTNLVPSAGIILDNSSALFSGTWTLAASSAYKYGTDYRFIRTVPGAATGIATFNPNLPVAGLYSVYLWYSHGSNRPTNAPVTLIYPGGATNFFVDQTIGGGQWRLLASHVDLPSGSASFLQIANNAGYTGRVVMADAVQFLCESPREAATKVTPPASRLPLAAPIPPAQGVTTNANDTLIQVYNDSGR